MWSIELYTHERGYHYKCKHLSKPKGLNNSGSLLFKGFTLLTAFSHFFLTQDALAMSANWFVQWASDLNCKTTGTAAIPPLSCPASLFHHQCWLLTDWNGSGCSAMQRCLAWYTCISGPCSTNTQGRSHQEQEIQLWCSVSYTSRITLCHFWETHTQSSAVSVTDAKISARLQPCASFHEVT